MCREGSFLKRIGEPILPIFNAKLQYSVQYSLQHSASNNVQYKIKHIVQYIVHFSVEKKGTTCRKERGCSSGNKAC